MLGKRRTLMLMVAALGTALVIMIAALMYNPQNGSASSVRVEILGLVVDENGYPVGGVEVTFGHLDKELVQGQETSARCYTNGEGRYTIYLDPEHFPLPCEVHAITWSSNTHWDQIKNLSLAAGQTTAKLDFILLDNINVSMPVGPMVFVSAIDGSTQYNITTRLNNSLVTYGVYSNIERESHTSISPFEQTYIAETNTSSLAFSGIGFFISGCIFEDGSIKWTNLYFEYNADVQIPNSGFIKTTNWLSADYLDRSSVSSESQFFDLTYGQNRTITVSPNHNVSLPDVLKPVVTSTSLNNVMLHTNCTIEVTPESAISASVTIEPLTPGTHHYQVVSENDYMIHVWEVA
jgi:hypothetical protein